MGNRHVLAVLASGKQTVGANESGELASRDLVHVRVAHRIRARTTRKVDDLDVISEADVVRRMDFIEQDRNVLELLSGSDFSSCHVSSLCAVFLRAFRSRVRRELWPERSGDRVRSLPC
jgi:hypothetical protein